MVKPNTYDLSKIMYGEKDYLGFPHMITREKCKINVFSKTRSDYV